MGDFYFNGRWASDFGLVVERHPRQYVPRKRLTTITIPGRSEPLHQWDGSFEPFPQRYECWFKSSPVAGNAHRIKEWLLAAPAGARLEDTYDEDVFHLATYAGGADIENALDRFGRVTLDFTCAAPAYLKRGEEPIRILPKSPTVVRNDGVFPAYPLLMIKRKGGGGCVVAVGDREIGILWSSTDSEAIYFDCALHEAWELIDGTAHPVNSSVNIPAQSFPVLEPGDNLVELRGGAAEYLELTPRTWTV